MHLTFSGPRNQYASAAVSIRNGSSVRSEYTYLGKVISLEDGIFYNRDRGYFKFELSDGTFSDVPDDFVIPEPDPAFKGSHYSVDFGDAYFLDMFLWKSGFMKVIDSLPAKNRDTLHSMILFYVLSTLANRDANIWYQGSITRLMYPQANMHSQRISEFLALLGNPDNRMIFQKAWLDFILNHYDTDRNVLIDSTGLPNRIHMPQTNTNVHNGKVSCETRLIFVVQKHTGLPLFYESIPGNIVDVSTLERVMLHLKNLHVNLESCILDAGYNSAGNLDLFYDDSHRCKIGFITRVSERDPRLAQMIKEELPTMESRENFVAYKDRYVFMKKKKVMCGTNNDNPAWMYLGLDCSRVCDEQRKLMKRAKKQSMTKDDVFEAMQTEGLFAILSGEEYTIDEILPAYYQRQDAEQIFDIVKNYTKMLPLRTEEPDTYAGHLLLGFIASCAVKMIQLKLKTEDLFLGSRLACLRNIKCTIYEGSVVTDVPQAEARQTYEAMGLTCPTEIPIIKGRLDYKFPDEDRTLCTDAPSSQELPVHRGRGRPKGSKNKKTLAKLAEVSEEGQGEMPKRGRGRPKGSKNQKTLEREAAIKAAAEAEAKPHRGRGRPKGSKNKSTLARQNADPSRNETSRI